MNFVYIWGNYSLQVGCAPGIASKQAYTLFLSLLKSHNVTSLIFMSQASKFYNVSSSSNFSEAQTPLDLKGYFT